MVTILIGIGIGMVSYDKLKGIEHNECIRLYDICTEKYNDCNLARTGTIQGVIYNGTQEFRRTVERDYIPTPDWLVCIQGKGKTGMADIQGRIRTDQERDIYYER